MLLLKVMMFWLVSYFVVFMLIFGFIFRNCVLFLLISFS